MNKSVKQSGKLVLTAAALAVLLAACGGGGGGSSAPAPNAGGNSGNSNNAGNSGNTGDNSGNAGNGGATATGNQFTKKATWTVAVPKAGQSVCYDFEGAVEVAGCTGTAWDLKLSATGARGTVQLFTNSGVSGTGKGGVYAGEGDDLIDWSDLLKWESGTRVPGLAVQPPTERIYFADASTGVFSSNASSGSTAYEYGLTGTNTDHRMYPTYRVFLVASDKANTSTTGTAAAPVYALQVIGYYGGDTGTQSGYPKFRWVNRADGAAQVREATVNASADKWVYFNLETGTEVASETGTWHVAFNRYRMRLNSTGTLGAAVGITPDGFYDAEGKPNVAAFTAATPASTLAYLTSASIPATAQWQSDTAGSRLNPAMERESNGTFDFGWYKYYPSAALAQAAGLPATAHILGADPSEGAMIKGGDGASFARFHLTKIDYANPADATSQQTWTFEFDVQPGAAK